MTDSAQWPVGAVISMCAPHRIAPCFYEACLPVIKIQMVFTRVVGGLFGGCVDGKDFCFFLRLHFTHSSIRIGGREICKLMRRQNNYLPLKKATSCACNMCGW